MTTEWLMLGGIMRYEYKGRRWDLMEVDSEDTIYSVMLRIEEITGIPAVFQRFFLNIKSEHIKSIGDCKHFYYDSPGTLAENRLVPTYPGTIAVDFVHSGFTKLQRDTLRNMGFSVYNDKYPEKSVQDRIHAAAAAADKEVIMVTVKDYIRMDGGGQEMVVLVIPELDTVASVMEEAQRRRRYPVAMQRFSVGAAGSPGYMHTRMENLDATLAEYNVTSNSQINMYFNDAYGILADRVARGLDKPMEEIATASGEQQQKPADDEEK